MPAEDVIELISIFRALRRKHFWLEQEEFEIDGGMDADAGAEVFEMPRTIVGKTRGVWTQVNSLLAWSYGLPQLQIAASADSFGDWTGLADLMQLFIQAGQLVLRSPQGACGCLMGAPLRQNTLRRSRWMTAGDFVFPTECFPYLPHILGLEDIDLCGNDATTVVNAAARKQLQLAMLFIAQQVESEFVRVALNNLRRNAVPIDPDVIHQRPPWRRAAFTAPAAPVLASNGVQHPDASGDRSWPVPGHAPESEAILAQEPAAILA
jgi:hypothetical protein